MSSRPVCPECRDGKHRNCAGVALDTLTDQVVSCLCRDGDCACPAREGAWDHLVPGYVVCLHRRGHTGNHTWRTIT